MEHWFYVLRGQRYGPVGTVMICKDTVVGVLFSIPEHLFIGQCGFSVSVDATLRYLSPEAFKIYLRFLSVKPLVLKGLTEKLKKSKVTSSSSCNVVLDKKHHFRRQRYLSWLGWLTYPRLLGLKPPAVCLGRRGRQECNVWQYQKRGSKVSWSLWVYFKIWLRVCALHCHVVRKGPFAG